MVISETFCLRLQITGSATLTSTFQKKIDFEEGTWNKKNVKGTYLISRNLIYHVYSND
jgi:hypothetical protein